MIGDEFKTAQSITVNSPIILKGTDGAIGVIMVIEPTVTPKKSINIYPSSQIVANNHSKNDKFSVAL